MPLMTPAEILEGAGPIRQPAAALVAQWVAAIPSVGFGQPVVIGGLARVLAARELGLAQVSVVRLGGPRGPKRNASRARSVGFDPKAGGLGVLGSLVWRPAVYSRHEVAWVSARAWRDTSKAEDLAALKAAKAERAPVVLEAAASEVATVLRRLRGDWSDHAVAPIPCGHSGPGCFGALLAQLVAEALGTEFLRVWQDRPLVGVSHPARNARLPVLVWVAQPAGPILVVDDVASTGSNVAQALMTLLPMHHRYKAWASAIRLGSHPSSGFDSRLQTRHGRSEGRKQLDAVPAERWRHHHEAATRHRCSARWRHRSP